jgi:transcriptional regulator with GAF, ATPase, and Fis domain
MHDPWHEFRTFSDWALHWARLPADLLGVTDFRARTVTLDSRLLQAERRCTVAHEVEHIRLGPVPADPVLAAREEAAIDRTVARKLIEIDDLGDALAWASSLAEAAQELWVDEDTLTARLRHLHPAEVHYLRRRLQQDPSG